MITVALAFHHNKLPRPSTASCASEFQLKLKHNKAPPTSPTACHGRHDGPGGAMAQQGDCLQVIANDCIPHRLMLKVSRHAQWKARP